MIEWLALYFNELNLNFTQFYITTEKRSKASDSQVSPYNNVTEALQRIAKESKINQLIVQRFGI